MSTPFLSSLVRWWRSWRRSRPRPEALRDGPLRDGPLRSGRERDGSSSSDPLHLGRPARPPAYPSWSGRAVSTGDPLVTLRRVLQGRAEWEPSPFARKLILLSVEGDHSFPVFPRAALDLDRALRRPHVSHETLAAIVRTDPSLTERVVRAASSAMAGNSVMDLPSAFARLGTQGIWRVAMSAILEAPVFRSPGWSLEADLARQVAVATGEIAAQSADPRVDPGLAFLAGTLHEIGTLQILRHAPADLSPHLLGQLVADLGPALAHHLVAGWDLDPRVAPLLGSLADDEDEDLTRRAVRTAQIAAHAAVLGDAEELELAAARLDEDPGPLLAEAHRVTSST